MNPRTVIKKLIPTALFQRVAPLGHLAEAVLYNIAYGFPARKFKVIGITGTNGKTTTTYMVHRMLREAGYSVGMMTTVAYGVNDDIRRQTYHMTNVPVPELMRRLKWMKKQGVEWLVLETTSHALVQHRVWGIPYSVAVMTNITHEHLDYHGTFENYLNAKRRLFKLANKNKKGLRTGIVNTDDDNARLFAGDVVNAVGYGFKTGHVVAKDVIVTGEGSIYNAVADDQTYSIRCNVPGEFNVSNSLAAVAVGRVLGLKKEQIEQGIAALDSVDGRMTRIKAGQEFDIIVDFAHTPDALQNVLETLKGFTKGDVRLVFGATGDRDKSKRPVMGEVAAKFADKIYLTDDETYTEDSATIIAAVQGGIVAAGGEEKLTVIPERLEAIKQAFADAKAGDTVLLAGIGHQNTRMQGGKEIEWDEKQIATELAAKRDN